MYLLDVFRSRYSVRNYQNKPISERVLKDVLEAGRWAATSRNQQARRFIVITDSTLMDRLQQEAYMQPFVKDASVLLVGIATNGESGGAVADVLISMTQMETMAVASGLGTCWIGVFDAAKAAQLLGIPDEHKIVCMMTIGYPAAPGQPRDKLSIEELYHFNGYKG